MAFIAVARRSAVGMSSVVINYLRWWWTSGGNLRLIEEAVFDSLQVGGRWEWILMGIADSPCLVWQFCRVDCDRLIRLICARLLLLVLLGDTSWTVWTNQEIVRLELGRFDAWWKYKECVIVDHRAELLSNLGKWWCAGEIMDKSDCDRTGVIATCWSTIINTLRLLLAYLTVVFGRLRVRNRSFFRKKHVSIRKTILPNGRKGENIF